MTNFKEMLDIFRNHGEIKNGVIYVDEERYLIKDGIIDRIDNLKLELEKIERNKQNEN